MGAGVLPDQNTLGMPINPRPLGNSYMDEMNENGFPCNGVMKRNSGTDTRPSPGRVGVSGQAPLGRNAMTVFLGEDVENQASLQTNATGPRRRKWSTNDNRLLMECYFKSRPDERGYRQRMHRIWRQSGGDVPVSEHRLADQVRTIKSKGWFSREELEDIKRHALTSSDTNNREHPPPQAPAAPPPELHDPSTPTTHRY